MKKALTTLGILIGACTICCAVPVLTLIGATSVTGIISLYNKQIGVVLFLVVVAVFAGHRFLKKNRATPQSCKTDCGCKTNYRAN